MDLRFTPEENAFRQEVRSWLRTAQPQRILQKMQLEQLHAREDLIEWHQILDDKGWLVPQWPKEYGGQGWNAVQFFIWNEELLRTPALPPLAHVNQVGSVLIAFGTDEQKAKFLKKIRRLEYWFCQGFSEPGSGSDLASLKTQAVREGDHYIVNGQKLWTTQAHYANWMYALVRTDPGARKQKGISYILIPMDAPGITVRPVITLDGARHVNEVFFDNVRVPVENLVGQENRGWDYAKFLLGHERMLLGRMGTSKGRLARAKALAVNLRSDGGRMSESPRFRERLALLEVELKALEITNMRVVDQIMKRADNRQDPKISILKLKGSSILQETLEVLHDVAGPMAMPRQGDFLHGDTDDTIGPRWAATIPLNYYFGRSRTITGGTNEVQRNIIAKQILGL
jgi:alkylation response protein AidB-like acyl-CoA dehydrogenase